MTAVEWLESQLTYKHNSETLNNWYDWKDLTEYYNKAKEMERKQIIDFATQFAKDYIGFDSVSTDPNAASPAEHYYNQIKK